MAKRSASKSPVKKSMNDKFARASSEVNSPNAPSRSNKPMIIGVITVVAVVALIILLLNTDRLVGKASGQKEFICGGTFPPQFGTACNGDEASQVNINWKWTSSCNNQECTYTCGKDKVWYSNECYDSCPSGTDDSDNDKVCTPIAVCDDNNPKLCDVKDECTKTNNFWLEPPQFEYNNPNQVKCYDSCPSGTDDSDNDNICIETCGNSKIDSGEQCDDGNTNEEDGCDAGCNVDPGWTCEDTPSTCEKIVANIYDLTEDDKVDITDILTVINALGQKGGKEDINNDGVVNIKDVLEVINNLS